MATASLPLSDSELVTILSLTPNATAIYRTEDIVIETASDTMIAFWGKDKSVIGMRIEDAVPELEGHPFVHILKEVWRSGITYKGTEAEAELRVNGKLQKFYFDYVYRAIKNESGEMLCILHTATEVTERLMNRNLLQQNRQQQKELEREYALNEELAGANNKIRTANEKLYQSQDSLYKLNDELEQRITSKTRDLINSERKLRYMLAEAPIAIALLTGREHTLYAANKKVLEAWGKTDEIVGKPLYMAVPELAGQPFLTLLDQVFESGEPFYGNEVRALLEQNGVIEEVYSNFVYYPLKDDNGQTTDIVLIANVITDLVVARKKAEQAEEMLRMATEAAELGSYYINTTDRIFIASPRLKEFFGFGPDEEVPYEAAINQIHPDYRQQAADLVEAAITQGVRFDMEYPVIGHNDSKIRWVRGIGTVQHGSDGKTFFTGILDEITEKKQDEIRKNDFIGMVSHELKTPLTSMSGYVQMLQTNAKENEDQFALSITKKANKQISRMTTLINGFLNVSRLESGKIQIDMARFDMAKLIQEAEEESVMMYNTHRIIFAPVEPILVQADRDKIRQVISNLITNAVKYSPANTTINVACIMVTGMAQVSVKDEGIGIKPEDQDKLFERYYRVTNDHSKSIAGFGIGLYVCSEVIQRHGGKIWVESEVGKGSTFIFSLPVIN